MLLGEAVWHPLAAQHPEVAPPMRGLGQAPLAGGLDSGVGLGHWAPWLLGTSSSRPSVLQPALLCEAQPGALINCVPGPARPGPVWAGMLSAFGLRVQQRRDQAGPPLPVQTLLSWDLGPPPTALRPQRAASHG